MNKPIGALIHTVKSNETKRWLNYLDLVGRKSDVRVFNAESGMSFDFLALFWQSGGRAAGQIETIVEVFTDLMSIGKVYAQSSGDKYFENSVQELMRATLVTLSNAKEPISITSMHAFISSLPTTKDRVKDDDWQFNTYAGNVINQLKKRKDQFSKSQWDDLDIAIVYLLEKWVELDDRTRSNIESTWSSLASKFTYDPMRTMFSSGRFDWTPEQITHDGLIVIIDVSVLEFSRQLARTCQILIKTVHQRAWLRHTYTTGCCNGAFLFQDEFPFLLSRFDPHFHMVCRESAIAPICISQNILSLAAEDFEEQTPGSKTLGFLGLFGARFMLQNNETITNKQSADLIGEDWQDVPGWNAGQSEQHSHFGVSGNKQIRHLLDPIAFTRLGRPDGDNPLAEAIAYVNGRCFNATKTTNRPQGLPYLRVHFSRE